MRYIDLKLLFLKYHGELGQVKFMGDPDKNWLLTLDFAK